MVAGLKHGSVKPAEGGSVDSLDSESISSACKRKKKNLSNLSDSASMDSFDSKEILRLTNMDYTQKDGTWLDPNQQGPLEQEHEIHF